MSKLINCSSCDKEISKSAKVCPHCGESNKKTSYFKIIFVSVLAVIIISGVIDDQEKSQQTLQANLELLKTDKSPVL